MDSREGRSRAERRKTPEAACSLRSARFLRARSPGRRRPSPDRAAAPRRPGRPRRGGDRRRALRRQWRPLRPLRSLHSLRPSRPLHARSPPIIRVRPNTARHPDAKSQDAVIGLRGPCASIVSPDTRAAQARSHKAPPRALPSPGRRSARRPSPQPSPERRSARCSNPQPQGRSRKQRPARAQSCGAEPLQPRSPAISAPKRQKPRRHGLGQA